MQDGTGTDQDMNDRDLTMDAAAAAAIRFSAGRNWVVTGLGLWMVVVAAVAGYAGPVAVWAVGALAVGLGFLAAAAETWAQRA
jgi:hypothetical protein